MWAELMTFKLTNMSEIALMLGMLVEVADGLGDREHLGFLDASQEAHPLLGWKFWVQKQLMFPALNSDGNIQWE